MTALPKSQPLLQVVAEKAGWIEPAAEAWDWTQDEPAPDYLVDRLIERGTAMLLSADTGAGKSWFAQALAIALAKGEPFLGRATQQCSVVYIDEENPKRLPRSRMRALGMTNEHSTRVHYFSRKGLRVGELLCDDWLERKINETKSQLLVVDTLMAATSVTDINSNDEVVAFYRSMRALTAKTGVTILILHHERKQVQGVRSGGGQAAMGARQIAGQADGHLTLQLKPGGKENTHGADGRQDLRTVLLLKEEKDRDGQTVAAKGERLVIESVKRNSVLVEATFFSEGDAHEDAPGLEATLLADICSKLRENGGEMKRAALATALGRKRDDGTFTRVLNNAVEAGVLTKPRTGYYDVGKAEPGI
jgi:hypothetical protein